MRILARAKINWTLDILGQRPDGYHLMDMLMQPISLADEVTLSPAPELSLVMDGEPRIPADAGNIALRAARALQAHTGCGRGAAIRIVKHIPAGAGLGGGSADAAAVLAGLNRLWGCGLTPEALEELGLTLGADVPFCLRGGLCRVQGIGERLTPLSTGPAWPLVIIQPCEGLSTGEVFRAWHQTRAADAPDTDAVQQALLRGDISAMPLHPGNALAAVSCAMRPPIGEAIRALSACGAFSAQMSGSGSAVYGAFAERAEAEAACAALRSRWSAVFLCESVSEPAVWRDSHV